MSIPVRFQKTAKVFAFTVTALFLPLSIGLATPRIIDPLLFFLPILAPFMFIVVVLGLLPWLVCLALLAGGLAIVISLRYVQRRWLQALLVAGLLAVIAFPFLYRYQPAVLPAPGHESLVVTAPRSFCQNVRRQSEMILEIERCHYELMGWDETEQLFYRSKCRNQPEKLWSIDPNTSDTPTPVSSLPETLYPIVSLPEAIDYVRADVYPASAERSVLELTFPQPWIVSPTGRWVAAISHHVYGPEDVIIISTD